MPARICDTKLFPRICPDADTLSAVFGKTVVCCAVHFSSNYPPFSKQLLAFQPSISKLVSFFSFILWSARSLFCFVFTFFFPPPHSLLQCLIFASHNYEPGTLPSLFHNGFHNRAVVVALLRQKAGRLKI